MPIAVARGGNLLGKTAVYLDGRREKVHIEETNRTIRIVTLNFLAKCVASAQVVAEADCGDGYPFNGLTAPDRADLHIAADFDPAYDPGLADFAETGSEQEALAEYLAAMFPAEGTTAFIAMGFSKPVFVLLYQILSDIVERQEKQAAA